ncbi:hypothetical protein Gogos_003664, partial [Gossypium gossypioides]|nr:hypothetical protein [Gossypium gossypioides]
MATGNASSFMTLFKLLCPQAIQLTHYLDLAKFIMALTLEVDDFKGTSIFLLVV